MKAEMVMAAPPRAELELPAHIRTLLRSRGYADDVAIARFLNPNYETDLGDPWQLTDMKPAIERILQAIKRREKVAVYGDYDIDGIVSTTLMTEVLQAHGLDVVNYIPDRYSEGYGIHIAALKSLVAQGVTLVVSVDCGITSVAEADWAAQHELDLVITDHHEVPQQLPEAVAVINPKRPGDGYAFKELAGVGVAFALVRALQQRTAIPKPGHEKWLLDLVAMGTVCDVMPLVGENRSLVAFGLKVLRKTRRVGIVALAQSADIELGSVRAYHLGFVFGPRLNAAGRLEHANFSLELLTTKDPIDAQALAFQLEELNHRRQLEQERIVLEAEALAERYGDDDVLVLSDTSWPHGIVGIVASKIAERFGKPTLILQQLDDHAKGSGRSANGYDLIAGLRACGELFTKLGGHHHAAGFTLPIELIDELRTTINNHYRGVANDLPPVELRSADIEIETPTDIDWKLYNTLELLEPFGSGNLQPCLGLSNIKIVSVDTVGKTKKHLKFKLACVDGTMFEAIGFGLAEQHPDLKNGQMISILCYLQKNRWNDRETLQLGVISLQS